MGNSDTAENKERGETRKSQKPVEDVTTVWSQVDECQASEKELKEGDNERTTLLINIGKDLWTHTVLCQSLECTGGGECAGVGDTHDGDQNHGIEN
jgi:hypothetical protein